MCAQGQSSNTLSLTRPLANLGCQYITLCPEYELLCHTRVEHTLYGSLNAPSAMQTLGQTDRATHRLVDELS